MRVNIVYFIYFIFWMECFCWGVMHMNIRVLSVPGFHG